MKKILFVTLIAWALVITNTIAEKIECTKFDIVSAKYLECSAKNLKKTSKLKLKTAVGSEELKEKIAKNAKSGKKNLTNLT